jgi:hypothetical protein
VAAQRATTSSTSSTMNMMRRMPSAFAGALSGSALTAGGVGLAKRRERSGRARRSMTH